MARTRLTRRRTNRNQVMVCALVAIPLIAGFAAILGGMVYGAAMRGTDPNLYSAIELAADGNEYVRDFDLTWSDCREYAGLICREQ